ncbi:MAG: penicillin-binding protein 1A [Holosporales bacterium]
MFRRFTITALKVLVALTITAGLFGAIGAYTLYWRYSKDLPDYSELKTYEPPVVTRLHTGDGRLLAEYAEERRIFVPIGAIPPLVKQAFLSAEDKNFYEHKGVDIQSIFRALMRNAFGKLANDFHRPQGASTITQQVTKNFLVGNEQSLKRKIREAILSMRIEKALPKDRILELYLNEIYLGSGSYGIAAASLNYFNKSLDDLTAAEAAYLASLPKAPNNYHPVRNKAAAFGRRNWVLSRMYEDNVISRDVYETAVNQPLQIIPRTADEVFRAEDFSEDVRRWLIAKYGSTGVYRGGLSVKTTLDPALQSLAETSLRNSIIAYDRRHGYRGAVTKIALSNTAWPKQFAAINNEYARLGWQLAVVTRTGKDAASLVLQNKDKDEIAFDLSSVRWARKSVGEGLGAAITAVSDVLAVGDVVYTRRRAATEKTPAGWDLVQPPEINGGFTAIDPHTGRVLAMVGGFNYQGNQFNRASQARRQPGSTFKPFVYLAALEHGFNPSTYVLDAPIAIDMGPGQGIWRPENYTREYYGLVPMRTGIEKSRNLMTIRIAQTIGMRSVQDVAARFGVYEKMPLYLSGALGVHETTLLRMVNGYAMFANGGKKLEATLIDRIQDKNGRTVYKHDQSLCEDCQVPEWAGQSVPQPTSVLELVTDPASAFQMVSMLEGTVLRGTATSLRALNKPLAGKTGTTNDYKDVWFVGFSSGLVAGVYIGYDEPRSLGNKETGSAVAIPAFRDFMTTALKDWPAQPFRIPKDVSLVRLNPDTGEPATSGDSRVTVEVFKRNAAIGRSEITGMPATGSPRSGGFNNAPVTPEDLDGGIY